MGKIIGGLITTILTIFITLYAQDWFTTRQKQTQFDIQYGTSDSTIKLSDEDRRALSNVESTDEIRLSIIDIENAGTEPLTDQRVIIKLWGIGGKDTVIAAGSTQLPGDTDDGISMSTDKSSYNIEYKLLNPKERHRLWLIYNGLGVQSLVARRPGLRVSSIDRNLNEVSLFDDPFFVGFVAVGFGLLTFGLGAVAGWSGLGDELGKRGFSHLEILKIKPDLPPPPQ